MKLNPDGTATLTIAGDQLTLRNPSWGELKRLRKEAVDLQKRGGELLDAWQEGLSESLPDDLKALIQLGLSGKMNKGAWEKKLKAMTEEDQTKILDMVFQIQVVIPETVGELVAAWWVDAIATLNGAEVTADSMPGSLANQSNIEQYLHHVETVPFDSGP